VLARFRWRARPALTLGALLLALTTSACAGARPYEREYLARKNMQFGAHPEADVLNEHVFQYREGSVGGYGGQGGGCGCN